MKHFNMTEAEIFNKIVEERRAIRKFDSDKILPEDVVARSLYRASLSPSSSNMQLYEFYRIRKKEDLAKLTKFCMNQSTAKTAHEMVIAVVRLDKYKQRAKHNHAVLSKLWEGKDEKKLKRVNNYYGKLMPLFYLSDPLGITGFIKKIVVFFMGFKRPVVRQVGKSDLKVGGHKSLALAVQTFMLSVQSEGYGTCPMEGMDSLRIKRWLKLPSKAEINMVISVGPPKFPEAVYNDRLRVPYDEIVKMK
jgi:nitroreductase